MEWKRLFQITKHYDILSKAKIKSLNSTKIEVVCKPSCQTKSNVIPIILNHLLHASGITAVTEEMDNQYQIWLFSTTKKHNRIMISLQYSCWGSALSRNWLQRISTCKGNKCSSTTTNAHHCWPTSVHCSGGNLKYISKTFISNRATILTTSETFTSYALSWIIKLTRILNGKI